MGRTTVRTLPPWASVGGAVNVVERQKVGGIAALVAAATFVFGIVLFATALSDYATGEPTPAESVEFLAGHQTTLFVWYLVIYIVFGVALVPLVLALHERVSTESPFVARIATAFGIVWAGLVVAAGMIANLGIGTIADLFETEPTQAESVWSSLDAVVNGLGGGNELVGGLWVLLVSATALASGSLPRLLCYLGVASGVAGVVTVLPALEVVGAVFGLGLIVWFTWVGILMVRAPEDTNA